MPPRPIGFALLLVVVIAGSDRHPALAGAFEVAPTTIELSPKARTALVRITNRGDQAVTIQVRPYDWRQSGGKDTLTPSTALLVSPATARLAPGGRQVVRLRELGPDSETAEQAHRLLVRELASADAVAAGQVRMLLQFSLPVFAPTAAPGAAGLSWDARLAGGQLILKAANLGPRHAKLVNLTIIGDGAAAKSEVAQMAYVLSGATRSWRLPVGALDLAANLVLRAEDGRTGRSLTWNVKVRRQGEGSAGDAYSAASAGARSKPMAASKARRTASGWPAWNG